MKIIAVLALALLATACGGVGMEGPTLQQYNTLSDEDRQLAAAEARKLEAVYQDWWDNIAMPLYRAHQPVRVGSGSTAATIQWHTLPGEYDAFSYYPGHDAPDIGSKSEGFYVALANKQGEVVYKKGEGGAILPNQLLANVHSTDDLGTVLTKGLFTLGGATLNGTVASLANNLMRCDDCGGPGAVAISNSGAQAKGVGNAESNSNSGGPAPAKWGKLD